MRREVAETRRLKIIEAVREGRNVEYYPPLHDLASLPHRLVVKRNWKPTGATRRWRKRDRIERAIESVQDRINGVDRDEWSRGSTLW